MLARRYVGGCAETNIRLYRPTHISAFPTQCMHKHFLRSEPDIPSPLSLLLSSCWFYQTLRYTTTLYYTFSNTLSYTLHLLIYYTLLYTLLYSTALDYTRLFSIPETPAILHFCAWLQASQRVGDCSAWCRSKDRALGLNRVSVLTLAHQAGFLVRGRDLCRRVTLTTKILCGL